jgi:hypothetical protein
MKRSLFFTLFVFFISVSVSYGQANVSAATLNFIRPTSNVGSFSSIQILINDQIIGDINNGSTFSYKLFISTKGRITIKISSAIYSQTLSFDAEPGKEYYFETAFQEQGVFILAIDQVAYGKHIALISSQPGDQGGRQTQKNGVLVTKVQENANNQAVSTLDLNKDDKSITYQYEKELDSEAIRKQWLETGGSIKGTSYVGGLSVLYKELGDLELSGYGVNVAFNENFINLKVPEYGPGRKSWNSLHWGYGVSGSYFYTVVENIWGDYDFDPIESSFGSINVNLNLGLTYGTGVFLSKSNWKGGVIELNYKPTLTMSFPEGADASTDFNFTGFSFDVNTSDFTSTMNKIAPKANFKFSLFVLPPVNDLPFFLSLSLGAVWYSK